MRPIRIRGGKCHTSACKGKGFCRERRSWVNRSKSGIWQRTPTPPPPLREAHGGGDAVAGRGEKVCFFTDSQRRQRGSFFTERMGLLHHLLEMILRHMGIDFRRGDVGMAQQ